MFNLTVYFDDSGTHPESDIAVAACYVASVEQWKEFERNWKEANEQFNFGVFRMADFVAKKAQFADESVWTADKRNALIKHLIAIIKTRARIGFCAALFKSDYDAAIPDDLKARLGSHHYTFAVRQCLSMIHKWRMEYNISEPMQYVFEDGTKGKGEIITTFDRVSEEPPVKDAFGLIPGGYSFIPKSISMPHLQAADILAWESLWHMKNTVVNSMSRATPKRRSFAALCSSPMKDSFFHEGNLKKLVEKTRETDAKRALLSLDVATHL